MVMVARMLGAEHVRQVMDDAGLDLDSIQRTLRERVVRQDLFQPLAELMKAPQPSAAQPTERPAMVVPPRPVLPERVKAKRIGPQQRREAA